jgi:hypothetical protein
MLFLFALEKFSLKIVCLFVFFLEEKIERFLPKLFCSWEANLGFQKREEGWCMHPSCLWMWFSHSPKHVLSKGFVVVLFVVGAKWHPSSRTDQNHCTKLDLPNFIHNYYENCHGPPRLFLLDKYCLSIFFPAYTSNKFGYNQRILGLPSFFGDLQLRSWEFNFLLTKEICFQSDLFFQLD